MTNADNTARKLYDRYVRAATEARIAVKAFSSFANKQALIVAINELENATPTLGRITKLDKVIRARLRKVIPEELRPKSWVAAQLPIELLLKAKVEFEPVAA